MSGWFVPAEADGSWNYAFDVLRQRDPATALSLAEAFPEFGYEISGLRRYGKAPVDPLERDRRLALAREALARVAVAVTRSLDEVLGAIRRRALVMGRLRLGANLASTIGSAGVLAFLAQRAGIPGATLSALVATAGSLLGLFASHVDGRSGTAHGIAGLRAAAFDLVGPVARLTGQIELGLATRDDRAAAAAMTALTAFSAKLNELRAKLDLPNADPIKAK